MELERYNDRDERHVQVMQSWYIQKYIDKYTNKGVWRVLSLLGVCHSDLYMLIHEREVVGIVRIVSRSFGKYHDGQWIENVQILPGYQGKGYSKELMRLAIEKCRGKRVYLKVGNDNIIARHLYEHVGFEDVEVGKDERVMRCGL